MRRLGRTFSDYFDRDKGADTFSDDVSFCYACVMSSKASASGVANLRVPFCYCGSDPNEINLLVHHGHDDTREVIDFSWTNGYAGFLGRQKYFASNAAIFSLGSHQMFAGKIKLSTGAVKVWVNGVELDGSSGSGAGFGATTSKARVLNIGRYSGSGGSRYFDGDIGRIGIWLGTALSDADLQDISNGLHPLRAGTQPTDFIIMPSSNQASSADEPDTIRGTSLTCHGTPAVSPDFNGLYKELSARQRPVGVARGMFAGVM